MSKQVKTNRIDLYARYIGDYLAYAEFAVDDENYWPDYYSEEEDETILLVGVPTELAEKLAKQGTSEQYFSDGYEAASAAAPYVYSNK